MWLALLLSAELPTSHAQNLVANPGFEQLAPQGHAESWPLPKYVGAEFRIDEEVAHNGRRSARVDGTDPAQQSNYVQAWRQDVGPLPNGELWLSVWAKADGITGARVNVLHKDKDGQVLLNQTVRNLEGTFDWQEVAGALQQVADAVSLQLVMGLTRSPGTVWFDDVSVAPLGDVGAAFGRVTMAPEPPQRAGASVPTTFTVTLGRDGLAQGGSLQLRWENWRPAREFRLQNLRVEVAATTFEVTIPPRKTTWPPTPKPVPCIATLTDGGPLTEGTQIGISADLTYTQNSNVSCDLTAQLSPAAGAALRPLEGRFTVSAVGGPAEQVFCTAEACPRSGESGRVTVAVGDAFGNPAGAFRGIVKLGCNTDIGLPPEYAFTERDRGSHVFAGRFPDNVISRITAALGEASVTSNPVLPRAEGQRGAYFGDIHVHCEISADAVGDPDQAYDYARRFLGLDFAGLSDHSPRGAAWQRNIEVTNRHNDPGHFATILGFEWSDGVHGHRNAYYRGDVGPEQPAGMRDNMQSWWDFYDDLGIEVLTVPHHPNTDSGVKGADGKVVWGPMDWSVINHRYQRVVEICQARGSFEVPGGPLPDLRVMRDDCGSSVQTALAQGHRLGFIGSTDTHSGRPGNGPARCVVLSDELVRESLWDSLEARRCYATSGEHILVFFTANGQQMGSEVRAEEPNARRVIEWRVIGAGPISRVDLIRNNEVVLSQAGEGALDVAGDFAYLDPLAGTEWYYLRVVQEDTEMAWSSPVWIDPA